MSDAGDFCDRLLMIGREAHASGHYEVAYHALMAALHAAETAMDEERLLAVEATARSQLAAIDAAAPTHRMSSQKALSRPSGVNLYGMLVRQAAAQLAMLHARQAQERREARWQ